ncbi:MAG: SidA/IucD/PvdA family monooxygenase [Sphingobacteriales bacterium]|nr:SidA/IucD/PvdA family monooxygenase [Sphingobacteriales bacterium]OJW01201.1 MAG: hypothetical protein BGO52_07150 [Sphingobacteriales bacterium 44-61]
MSVEKKVFDIVGIGIGPFNLGLAALCHNIPDLKCLFIDQEPEFNWHPGMMIEGTRMQVPFYADLVTLSDPQSPFSYMAYLKAKEKMFRFAIRENYFIKRSEYNDYCRWVAGQLSTLQFSTTCKSIQEEGGIYKVETNKESYLAKHIVIGIGTIPSIPSFVKTSDRIFHSSEYLLKKSNLLDTDHIAIIGSGQSAAEIFNDLLNSYPGKLTWFTRSSRFFPMDFSKLSLELSTPDYIHHFVSLSPGKRKQVLQQQDDLYKGINRELISAIYDRLDDLDDPRIQLYPNCELRELSNTDELKLYHLELKESFTVQANCIILATGYQPAKPAFLHHTQHLISEANRNYSIDENNSIFIQNAEQSTHGFNASDLSLGPYRNAVILNSILGHEHFTIESNTSFQHFGLP